MLPTRRIRSGFFVMAAGAYCLGAQTPKKPDLRFDVASVRLNKRFACAGPWDFSAAHDTVRAVNAPLLRIVSRAYRLTDDRIKGPSWLDSQCYDITAKAGPGGGPAPDLMSMLQTLLRERFHLAGSLVSDRRPVFALVVDQDGLKLPRDGEKIARPQPDVDGKVLFMAKTLRDLCERLGKVAGRPVIDQTGLQGKFVIVLSYPPDSNTGDPDGSRADIFSAVREQLGLRLEAREGIVEVLKIDSIDKIPSAN